MSNTLAKSPLTDGYSAEVRMELHVGDRVLYPTHTASEWVTFPEPQLIAPAVGRLVISIDDVVREMNVRILPQKSPGKRVPIQIIKNDL
jgi:hypothetical protein